MTDFQITFNDCTADPSSARAGAEPAKGLSDSWLDALVGVGDVRSRSYAAPGMLSETAVVFPSSAHGEQFALALRQISKLLGTRAEIHVLSSRSPRTSNRI
jgi:hypothetical protein